MKTLLAVTLLATAVVVSGCSPPATVSHPPEPAAVEEDHFSSTVNGIVMGEVKQVSTRGTFSEYNKYVIRLLVQSAEPTIQGAEIGKTVVLYSQDDRVSVLVKDDMVSLDCWPAKGGLMCDMMDNTINPIELR